ncbi:MAG: plasmid partitioning protein RepB [Martelella sp.]|uniref:plasmid partitioning protein RepB n=1 Tax=Martelella sp. TaxID=1969699 RepID=UPI0032429110
MSRKDAINSLYLQKPTSTAGESEKASERVRTGAISAMGTSLKQMTDGAKLASRLQEQLEKGDVVVELDPEAIERSPIADRIPIDVDPAFDELVKSISDNGQQVPILVRPSPAGRGRFQIAYGRRRLRAAQALGRPVRAIVRSLNDQELFVAQGRENLDREDLSFIEKAFFAKNLEDSGCDRATIVAALCSDKSDVSRYIAIARRVPERLVGRIGPAPKAGRARWMKLVDALEKEEDGDRLERIFEAEGFASAGSDARFQLILKALDVRNARPKGSRVELWKTPSGKRGARIQTDKAKTTLIFEDKIVPAFAQFVSAKLDELYQEFEARQKEEKDRTKGR